MKEWRILFLRIKKSKAERNQSHTKGCDEVMTQWNKESIRSGNFYDQNEIQLGCECRTPPHTSKIKSTIYLSQSCVTIFYTYKQNGVHEIFPPLQKMLKTVHGHLLWYASRVFQKRNTESPCLENDTRSSGSSKSLGER